MITAILALALVLTQDYRCYCEGWWPDEEVACVCVVREAADEVGETD